MLLWVFLLQREVARELEVLPRCDALELAVELGQELAICIHDLRRFERREQRSVRRVARPNEAERDLDLRFDPRLGADERDAAHEQVRCGQLVSGRFGGGRDRFRDDDGIFCDERL